MEIKLSEVEIRSIIEQLKVELLPIGSILIYSSENVPLGFLPCDGRELSKSSYPELYALIKGTWGETLDTFCLPDMQGQFIRAWDKDGDIDPERKFGSFQDDAIQGHCHNVPSRNTSHEGTHTHKVYYKTYKVGSNTFKSDDRTVYEIPSSYDSSNSLGGDPGTSPNGSHNHTVYSVFTEGPINHTYGPVRIASETRPKNIVLMFCIKVK